MTEPRVVKTLGRRRLGEVAAAVASVPLLGSLASCAPRVDPERALSLAPQDGRLVIARSLVPELGQPGGAVVIDTGTGPILVFNAGGPGAGEVRAVSAICPHQGCTVAWEPENKLIECPCHLSSFASDGQLLHGPAGTDLLAFPVDASGTDLVVRIYPGDGVFPDVVAGQVSFPIAAHAPLGTVGGIVIGRPEGAPVPFAVVRLSQTEVITRSARCTHLGCTVQPATCGTRFPNCQKGPVKLPNGTPFLHCPCHSSAFKVTGEAIGGPSVDTGDLQAFPTTFDGTNVVITL